MSKYRYCPLTDRIALPLFVGLVLAWFVVAWIAPCDVQAQLKPLVQAVEIEINGTPDPNDDYITWAPTFARARLRQPIGPGLPGGQTVTIVLTNDEPSLLPIGGDVAFAPFQTPWPLNTTATQKSLTLKLPRNGKFVRFVVAGRFGRPSTNDKDAVILARLTKATGQVIGRHALMVRVRKNANRLTALERQRYLTAVRTLYNQNRFFLYQDIHAIASSEAHGGPAFPPWHRAFVLHIERALQSIDPSVALHYWKFDEAAPNIFSSDFMGANAVVSGFATVNFSNTNPLSGFVVPNAGQLRRSGSTNHLGDPPVQNDPATLTPNSYSTFRPMEGDPHGSAHVWVGGWMGSVPSAARDPLFFFLHSNVDRLWAKWQHQYNRFGTTADDYSPSGAFPPSGDGTNRRLGHYLTDTMWPWNGMTGFSVPGNNLTQRPATAPGGSFPSAAPFKLGPPPQPKPIDTIDYLGRAHVEQGLGYGYDDVPY